jgi:hypothetical protein
MTEGHCIMAPSFVVITTEISNRRDDAATSAVKLSLFDHPVGMAKQRKRYGRAECIRSIQEEISIDKDFKFAAVQRL